MRIWMFSVLALVLCVGCGQAHVVDGAPELVGEAGSGSANGDVGGDDGDAAGAAEDGDTARAGDEADAPAADDRGAADDGAGARDGSDRPSRDPNATCENTGFPGDDVCPAAVPEGEGFQIHFGPRDYGDPEEVAKYVLEPGGEALKCQYVTAPNDELLYYADWLNTLRPSSHHMIVTQTDDGVPDGFGDCDQGSGTSSGLVGGNSTSVSFFDEVAPENEGIARTISPNAKIEMQLHFFNPTDEPLLMEAWQNIYAMDPQDVKEVSATIFGLAGFGMNVPPGQSEIIAGSMQAPADMRVMSLLSHNHNHTVRFSAYLEKGGVRTKIYESYDWEHPAYLPFDSIHENPAPDFDSRTPGGHSGILELSAGDWLHWECEIVNDDLDIPLVWANRALDAEMCNLHGLYTPSFGGGWTEFVR